MADMPKQELLIKLLNMTTAEDNVALVAVRKANALLADAGWTWEQLLRGKIVVVEDPFNNLDNMFQPTPTATRAPASPPRPKTQPAPPPSRPTPAANRPFIATAANPISSLVNKFLSYCYCCGVEVPASIGYAFKPIDKNPAAPSKWHVVCTSCNTTGTIYHNATGQRPTKKRGQADINSLI